MADPHALEEVRRVVAAHRTAILARFSAVGLGVGRPEPDGPYVITVYVERLPERSEPMSVEDVPIRLVVTGPFRAQRGERDDSFQR